MSSTFLALACDKQTLSDITNSGINCHDMTLFLPQSLANEEFIKLTDFKKIIAIDGYFSHEILPDLPYKIQPNFFPDDPVIALAIDEFQQQPFDGIIATHEDDLLRAAWLRDVLHLPGQSYKSAYAFRSKTTMKEILKQNGIAVPKFKIIKSPQDIINFINNHPFPFVIKPDLGTGSSGITILHNQEEATNYLNSKVFLNEHLTLEIEAFVEGKMYHVNGFFKNEKEGYFWPAIYPQQSICMAEGKFASSHTLSEENPLVNRLNIYAKTVLNILPTPPNTAFHLEVFITPLNDIIFCEIASRIGGKGVRGSWKECFGISLGNLFVHGQAVASGNNSFNKIFNGINQKSNLHPKNLSGEIWFPVQEGQLIHIEDHCPFPWVKEYHTFYKTGDVILKQSDNINDCLCGVSLLIAETEKEMQKRLDKVAQWVYDTTHWAPL